jgi:DNA polymerase V
MDWDDNPKFIYEREPSRDILCIDCKSFYASVECVERGLNPLSTKLVVMSYPSDNPEERGSGLILASSPAAKKAFGISNISRARDLPFPYPADLILAAPRMRLYMQKNMEINNIYRKYADENNHAVFSVDESFLDVTDSLKLYGCERGHWNIHTENSGRNTNNIFYMIMKVRILFCSMYNLSQIFF